MKVIFCIIAYIISFVLLQKYFKTRKIKNDILIKLKSDDDIAKEFSKDTYIGYYVRYGDYKEKQSPLLTSNI